MKNISFSKRLIFVIVILLWANLSCNLPILGRMTQLNNQEDLSSGSSDSQSLVLEELPLQGTVTLPESSTLLPNELTILTLNNTYPVNPDGTFEGASLHAPDAPQLMMAVNSNQNPVLMGIFGDSQIGENELSVDSTAQSFVLYDLAVLSLPPEQRSQVSAALNQHPQYPALRQAVGEAILNDPVDPLGDAHDELYRLAAEITADLLDQIGLIPHTFQNSIKMASLTTPAYDEHMYLAVEDDNQFGPEVILVNKTMSYYQVTASLNGKPWAPAGGTRMWLVRNNLYGTIHLDWPPVSYRRAYEASIGDGDLAFHFVQDRELTLTDLLFSSTSTLLGIGKSVTTSKDLQLLLSLKGALADLIRDMLKTIPQTAEGQMSYTKAISYYTWVLGYDGGKAMWAIASAIAKNEATNVAKSGLASRIVKFAAKKLMTPISLAYGSADSAAMIYSLSNSPAEATFQGTQKFGIYPAVQASIAPSLIKGTTADNPFGIKVDVTGIPERITALKVSWEFNNGEEPLEYWINLRHQHAYTETIEHKFPLGNYPIQVTAFDLDSGKPLAIAGAQVEILEGPTDTPQPSYSGKWQLDRLIPEVVQGHSLKNCCYNDLTTSETTFSNSFGCNNEDCDYPLYDAEANISWTAFPKILTPGEPFPFTVDAKLNILNGKPPCELMPNYFINFDIGQGTGYQGNGTRTYTFTVPDDGREEFFGTITLSPSCPAPDYNVYGLEYSSLTITFVYKYVH